MSLKHYRTDKSRETDGSEVLEDRHHVVSRDQLVPRIIERNKQAVLTDRRYFHFYQKKQAGRRCSCFNLDTSPSGHCQICHGNGIVGGYDKYGTISHTFDVTYPGITAVNIRPDFESESRPLVFTLDPLALSGYLEMDFDVRANLMTGKAGTLECPSPDFVVDITQVVSTVRKGNTVAAFVKAPAEGLFVPLTEWSLGERLTEQKLTLRVEMSRTSYNQELPILSHVFLRYKLCEDLRIKMDIPRQQESITLAEYGIYDSFSTINAWLATDLRKIGTEDFFRRLEDGTYWKVIESSPNKPLGQLTSHDLVMRLVQNFEGYVRVP